MTEPEARSRLVAHWLERAEEALVSARREYDVGDLLLAVNRAYYACFYAATAFLLREKHEFTRHAAVRDAVHLHLIKPGLLGVDAGRAYDALFRERSQADYAAFVDFDPAEVHERIEQALDFVAGVKRLTQSG
jgi:uncharacterized protein (UPF0332 family)